jgi:DNA-binding protein HU-beta
MTKSDLINIVARKTGISKMHAEQAINSFIESLTDGLRDEKLVKITGLGSFRVRKRRAREGIDPKTKIRVELDESMTIGFRPSRLLRERIGAVRDLLNQELNGSIEEIDDDKDE